MASCKSCGYYIPDDAEKCAHCGTDVWLPRFFRFRFYQVIWKTITALISVSTLIVAGVICWQGYNLHIETQITQKQFEIENIPVVRIGPVSFNATPYVGPDGEASVFLSLAVPVTNKHGFAENVRIVKKDLQLIRGPYGLSDETMQSPYTKIPFDLSLGETIYDNIHIDESPQNYDEFLKGVKPFILEYEIHYTSMPEVTNDAFVFYYKVKISRGELEVLEQRTTRTRK